MAPIVTTAVVVVLPALSHLSAMLWRGIQIHDWWKRRKAE